MEFYRAGPEDLELVYSMMLRARQKLFEEKIFQWDDRYPTLEMLRNDLYKGYTSLVRKENKIIGFFTSNSICEDDVHDNISWIYNGDRWVILHRLCVDPEFQDSKLGQEILTLFEQQSIHKGFESIRIDVFSTNAKAIYIYEKFGYTRVGEAICERGPFFVYEKCISNNNG